MVRLPRSRVRRALLGAAGLLVFGSGCRHPFNVKAYQRADERLYAAAMREYRRHHWDNAVSAFERLTTDLPARDTLLPRSHYYLGMAHARQRDNLLAAQSFSRLVESFPDDSLADDALMEAGRAYQRLWRKTVLDAQYGQSALSTYRTLLSLYPTSSLRPRAEREIARLEQEFATKDYDVGRWYVRRKAYDPAIIYFKDVVRLYPNTPRARDAYLSLVDAYRAIRYRAEANETCAAMRQTYPQDREVRRKCAGVPANIAAPSPPPARDSTIAADSTGAPTTPKRDSTATATP